MCQNVTDLGYNLPDLAAAPSDVLAEFDRKYRWSLDPTLGGGGDPPADMQPIMPDVIAKSQVFQYSIAATAAKTFTMAAQTVSAKVANVGQAVLGAGNGAAAKPAHDGPSGANNPTKSPGTPQSETAVASDAPAEGQKIRQWFIDRSVEK